jgi:hypothetical protein
MNSLVSVGTAASARASTANPRVGVRELIKELRAQHKRASEVELAKRLVDVLEDDHDALLLAAQFIVHVVKGEAARSRRRANGASHAEHCVAVKAQAVKLAEKVKATLVLDNRRDCPPVPHRGLRCAPRRGLHPAGRARAGGCIRW